MIWFNSRKHPENLAEERLGRLIRSQRESHGPEPRLSEDARSRILTAVQRESTEAALPSLFTPTRRLVLTGLTPMLLAVALFALADRLPQQEVAPSEARVMAVKEGNRVVFTISNGDRDHFVARSESPDDFGASAAQKVTDGAFEDRLDNGSGLVFYRID